MKLSLRLLYAVAAVCCVGSTCAQTSIEMPIPGMPWPATDALGRKLPLAVEVGAPKTNRFVGIFYFEWLVREMQIPKCPNGDGPYDVEQDFGA